MPSVKTKQILPYALSEITFFGGLPFYLSLLIASYLFSVEWLTFKLALGLLALHIIPIVIRLFYHKNRPNKEEYGNLLERLSASSFPSVHSARAFFLGITLFEISLPLGIFMTLAAALVAFSRVYLRKHYLLDVLAGALLGLLLSFLL